MLDVSHSILLNAIHEHAVKNGTKAAIIANDITVSYEDLWKHILYTATYLQSLNLKRGDYVLLAAQKEVEFVYLYFAAHLLGIINVIVDPTSSVSRKDYIINIIRPKRIFGLKLEKDSIAYNEIVEPILLPTIDGVVFSDDVADIMFTTGTTGNPKGVLLTHDNIAGSAENINSFIKNREDDIELLGLPICHSFGLGRLRCTLLKGATIILLGSFANLKLFFSMIEQYHVTGFGMVPAVWEYMKKLSGKRIGNYQHQIHYIEIGSAGMSIADKRLLCELFPKTRICMHYGLTEASRSLFMEFHENEIDLTTIGRPVTSDVDVKVFDEYGKEVALGEAGELCVKGNMVMKSYYTSVDNDNAFWGEYFRTGDYGYCTAQGNYYLISRKKELINIGGKKVSPVEIENMILDLGGVSDCVCVPIKDPKLLLGEVPKVYILRAGTTLSFEEIKKRLIGKIESYKMPVEYEWIDTIPMTSSGKKQRLLLCQNYQ